MSIVVKTVVPSIVRRARRALLFYTGYCALWRAHCQAMHRIGSMPPIPGHQNRSFAVGTLPARAEECAQTDTRGSAPLLLDESIGARARPKPNRVLQAPRASERGRSGGQASWQGEGHCQTMPFRGIRASGACKSSQIRLRLQLAKRDTRWE